jgi:hypothetical protein
VRKKCRLKATDGQTRCKRRVLARPWSITTFQRSGSGNTSTTTPQRRGTRGRTLCERKVDMLAAATRGNLSFNEGARRGRRQTPLGVGSREPEPVQYRTWPADPGSVANLYCIGSSQHRPGVVARCCRPSLLLHPRAVGEDRQCCCCCLVMLLAAVVVEWHLSRVPFAVAA